MGRPKKKRKVSDFEPYSRTATPKVEERAEKLLADLQNRKTVKKWQLNTQKALVVQTLRLCATVRGLRDDAKAVESRAKKDALYLADLSKSYGNLAGEISRLTELLPDIWAEDAKVCNVPDCYEPQVWLPDQDPARPQAPVRVGLCEKHRREYVENKPHLGAYLDRPESCGGMLSAKGGNYAQHEQAGGSGPAS